MVPRILPVKPMKRFAALVVGVLAFVLSAQETVRPLWQEMAINDVTAGTVVIESPTGLGAGFVVGSDGIIVTNHHVIAGDPRAVVSLKNGDSYPVRYVYVTPELFSKDLAILQIAASGMQNMSLAASPPPLGGELFVVGHPHGHKWTLTKGYLAGSRFENGRDELQISADTSPGNSGGPICLPDGTVIGVHTYHETRVLSHRNGLIVLDPSKVLKFGVSVSELQSYLPRLRELPHVPLATLASVSRAAEASARCVDLQILTYEAIRDARIAISKLGMKKETVLVPVRERKTSYRDGNGHGTFGHDVYTTRHAKQEQVKYEGLIDLYDPAAFFASSRATDITKVISPHSSAVKKALASWRSCIREAYAVTDTLLGTTGVRPERAHEIKKEADEKLIGALRYLHQSVASTAAFLRENTKYAPDSLPALEQANRLQKLCRDCL